MVSKEAGSFRAEQKAVAVGMATALLISIVVIAASLRAGNPSAQSAELRLLVACRAGSVVGLFLFAAIANVARLRFFSPSDIDGSGMTDATGAVRIGNAVLQNTLEQGVFAVIVYLVLAATLPRPSILLMALVSTFGVGRLCFWLGYRKGAGGRAFGFALTFYPTALALILMMIVIATGWSPQG